MPPKKNNRSNNMTSQDGLEHAIHAMRETRREMADTIKELKSSVSKPREENERLQQEESAAARKGSEQKGPSFVTQEDTIAMLEKEPSRS
ncbi:unnamed protein product [Prunus armeniaca]